MKWLYGICFPIPAACSFFLGLTIKSSGDFSFWVFVEVVLIVIIPTLIVGDLIDLYNKRGQPITLDKLKRKGRQYHFYRAIGYDGAKDYTQAMLVQYEEEEPVFVKLKQQLPDLKDLGNEIEFSITPRYDNLGRVMRGWLVLNFLGIGNKRVTVIMPI
jgi:hypothetical protein